MTATDVIGTLAHAGVTLFLEGGELRFRAKRGAYTDNLRQLVAAHRDAVMAVLARPASEAPASPGPLTGGNQPAYQPAAATIRPLAQPLPRGTTWPAELAAWIATVGVGELPPVPFELRPGVTVNGPVWLERLKADAAAGPHHPRARWGALQDDLHAAARLVGRANTEARD